MKYLSSVCNLAMEKWEFWIFLCAILRWFEKGYSETLFPGCWDVCMNISTSAGLLSATGSVPLMDLE